jgi:hypothetical protein
MEKALTSMAHSSPEFHLQGLELSSHLKLPPPEGKRHIFQTKSSKKDVLAVFGHVSAMVPAWNNAAIIHPKKEGKPFRTLTVNMTQKQEARQGFYKIEKKHEEVHDAIVRLVDETVQSALGPGATQSFNGDLVSYKIGGFNYSQSVSILAVGPGTPSQRYHRDGPTKVTFRGEEAYPVYYNIMIPLSTNCTDTEYEAAEGASVEPASELPRCRTRGKLKAQATPPYFEAGVEYYTFDGSQWHRGASNDTSLWQFKIFISLVQDKLAEAVTLPIIAGSNFGYADHVHNFV